MAATLTGLRFCVAACPSLDAGLAGGPGVHAWTEGQCLAPVPVTDVEDVLLGIEARTVQAAVEAGEELSDVQLDRLEQVLAELERRRTEQG